MKKLFFLIFSIVLFYCLISEKAVSQSTNKCLLSQGVIIGPQSVPTGSSVIYTTTPVENATTLLWTVPVGWIITSGQGTISITVTAGATFGNIFFYGYNECGVTVAFRALMVIANNSPVPVSITITSNPVGTTCSGTPVLFTAFPVNGGSSPFFQWMVNGGTVGGNSNTYSYTPVNNDAINCVLTSDLPNVFNNPATSNVLTMSVNPSLPVSVSIAASANQVCSGTSVTYTATPTNEGSAPVYQWKVNGVNAGTNSDSYSYTPSNNDAVTCVLTSNATCATGSPATSNIVTMTVNPLLPVSISVSPSSNPICSGTSVTYTATPTNEGSAPVYQWKVNGSNVGTNITTYSYSPVNNDVVTCVLTSNATCATGSPATSNIVTMTVNPILPVSVSVAASANPVYVGTSVTFTATPTNGGTTPSYQWKVNGSNVGTNITTYSYIPINNDVVTCVLTSNAFCATGNPATSNTVTMTVNSFSIGQSYGGGIIFYIDGTGQHGLIAATSDQSSGAPWCLAPNLIGGTSTAIGSGQANTTAIVTACSSSAAYICDILVLNGYNDWFLPSKDELYQLYLQRSIVGGFADGYYWSSSEYDSSDAWFLYFQFGFQSHLVKYNAYYVRAVRAF
jgi:hypothetical protein